MEIISVKENENKLFSRKEILAEIKADIVPKKSEALRLLSEKFSVPEDAIKIIGVYGSFGVKIFDVKANVYASKKDKEKIERKTKKEIEAEKKAEEARKQALLEKSAEEARKKAEEAKKAAEEKPAEEKTE
jgi:ribosomal protein S24E